ncbi:transcriptional regulator [Ureaplasma urealyticum]|uniref:Transcriptional regulator n=1 Tax=Ureaplasma urealyticum TaxID=2130 RepID=A0AAP9AAL6_UREUR|nr:transcriptional regulator [Ureaplasma urealyticum]QDI65180.1 transcriptional regulator [Ureaplasma urealyticum]RCJ00636.1 transcriptional regulator [Ureaplasma urealyticum]
MIIFKKLSQNIISYKNDCLKSRYRLFIEAK